MLLENKNAIIYGAGGGIGGGVARTFAREGAKVFLVGRTRATLEAVANDIKAAGGTAEIAVMDVLDEQAVEDHAKKVGRIDISFNLISRGDLQGMSVIDMPAADFAGAVTKGLTANFITAKAAARRMIDQKSGVIMMVTSGSSYGAPPMMGNTPSADAAMEALMRSLATELGPNGVRVLGIWTAAVPETFTPEKLAAVNSGMVMDEAGLQNMLNGMSQMFPLRHAPALAQVADTAAFLASDRAGSITNTIINVTCGLVPG